MLIAASTRRGPAPASSSWLITVVPGNRRALRQASSQAPATSARLRPQALWLPRTSRAARNIRSRSAAGVEHPLLAERRPVVGQRRLDERGPALGDAHVHDDALRALAHATTVAAPG